MLELVVSFVLLGYALVATVFTVEAPASAWAGLEAKITFVIEHLFEFYGDDAGWSFAARGSSSLRQTPGPASVRRSKKRYSGYTGRRLGSKKEITGV